MQKATLVFRYPDVTANALAGALSPELGEGVPKARATCTLDGDELRVAIEADDLSSLRAAVNSYLRWVDAAARAAGLGEVGRDSAR